MTRGNHWARAVSALAAIALLISVAPACAQQQQRTLLINEITDQEVLEALETLGDYLGGGLAFAEVTIVRHNDGEPQTAEMIHEDLAGKVDLPLKLGALNSLDEVFVVRTQVFTGSPACQLKESGGDYYWVPKNGCP